MVRVVDCHAGVLGSNPGGPRIFPLGITSVTRKAHYNNNEHESRKENNIFKIVQLVRGDRDSRANLMPIYGDLYQIKL